MTQTSILGAWEKEGLAKKPLKTGDDPRMAVIAFFYPCMWRQIGILPHFLNGPSLDTD
jgi:hypothetical protein